QEVLQPIGVDLPTHVRLRRSDRGHGSDVRPVATLVVLHERARVVVDPQVVAPARDDPQVAVPYVRPRRVRLTDDIFRVGAGEQGAQEHLVVGDVVPACGLHVAGIGGINGVGGREVEDDTYVRSWSLRPQALQRETVPQQQVMNSCLYLVWVAVSGGVLSRAMAEERAAPGLVEGGIGPDTVAKSGSDRLCVVGEGVRGVAA